jgi:L-ascorbate metabolism protein UlaG (beta-lactamase superfamily)
MMIKTRERIKAMANKNGKMRLWFVGGMPAGNDDGIGANCQLVEYEKDGKTTRILVDMGLKLCGDRTNPNLPEWEQPKKSEFDAIMPDFRMFIDGKDGQKAEFPLDAICLTHAHADHLDGLIYMTLYEMVKCAHENGVKMPKIIGSRYTKNTLYRLLRQQNVPAGAFPEYEILPPCKSKQIGGVEMTAVPVSHTTVGSYGYIFETENSGYFNPGDNREMVSHTGVGGNNRMMIKELGKHKITLVAIDSTSTGMKDKKKTLKTKAQLYHDLKNEGHLSEEEIQARMEQIMQEAQPVEGSGDPITLEKSVATLKKMFNDNPGKQLFSPTISRSIENWLPLLIASKELGKKVFIDGYQQRGAFRDWQNDNTVYYVTDDGQIEQTEDKNFVKKLREQGVKMYCAEDFRDTIWDYGNIMNANADNYVKSVGKKDRAVLISGAFAESSETQCSGGVKLARGEHLSFNIDKDTIIDGGQRIIKGINDKEVKNMYRGFLRQGATVYLNILSKPVLEADGDKDLLKTCIFVERQPSGHSKAEGTAHAIGIVATNCKNAKEFKKKGGYKLQVFGVHGNEEQRLNSIKAVAGDDRVEGHLFSNGDVVEVGPGYCKVVKHYDIENQRFLGIINETNSGEFILKPLNGVYKETNGEDIVIAKLSPNLGRGDFKTETELERAQALEEEGNKGSMNKYVIKHGKNAGKGKKEPQSDEKRKANIQRKIDKKNRSKEETRQRRNDRRQKKGGYDGY